MDAAKAAAEDRSSKTVPAAPQSNTPPRRYPRPVPESWGLAGAGVAAHAASRAGLGRRPSPVVGERGPAAARGCGVRGRHPHGGGRRDGPSHRPRRPRRVPLHARRRGGAASTAARAAPSGHVLPTMGGGGGGRRLRMRCLRAVSRHRRRRSQNRPPSPLMVPASPRTQTPGRGFLNAPATPLGGRSLHGRTNSPPEPTDRTPVAQSLPRHGGHGQQRVLSAGTQGAATHRPWTIRPPARP